MNGPPELETPACGGRSASEQQSHQGSSSKPDQSLLDDEEARKDDKKEKASIARLVGLGAQVRPLSSGGYLVTCGGFSRSVADVEILAKLSTNPGARE